ncbi:DUF4226 domain-containing protein [Mycobacterium asiaticum]|uniref:DUF4226 domain-containing protein n=1 Tax=Mycobacterium asiaticum TaxID=1790 RepID=UPI0007EF30DF|nr:DUF4226 domain-containing protein [Mycobacterium asiaticum]OBI89950.1 hypothetical protein A5661_03380 [Mycobacterium asiaticum]
MTTYQDLVDTMRHIQQSTGGPQAWMTGLTAAEVTDALSPATSVPRLDAILAKIRQQHPDLFSPNGTPPPAGLPTRTEGDAAKAIAQAETALAHQNSATSQLDLQVISAILNAHLTNTEGRDALTKLQQELESAVAVRTDLDTPAGARDFQRYLIGKLRDIREVVATASLDDTSKSALMAAWTSLYNASKSGSVTAAASGDPRPAPTPVQPASSAGGPLPASDTEPGLDPLWFDDPGLSGAAPPEAAAPIAPTTAPAAPGGGGATSPSGGGMPSWGAPSGLQLPALSGAGSGRDSGALGDGAFVDPDDRRRHEDKIKRDDDGDDAADDEPHDQEGEPASGQPEAPPAGPTTVTLPNGETVTAASPQLAAAIKAAASGTPIAEAFRQQGMTLPPPGSAVAHPIDPAQVVPGDIGMFTDRHALALGRSQALLEGQIQHISAVAGPSFLGWQHPPSPVTQPAGPAPPATDPPTPTRPSAITA